MEQYTIYCTEAQTKKALELGAPIVANKDYSNGKVSSTTLCIYGDITNKDKWGVGECTISHIPTAEQMIGWLEEQGIYIHAEAVAVWWRYYVTNGIEYIMHKSKYSRQEATLAAIDAALDYLSKK